MDRKLIDEWKKQNNILIGKTKGGRDGQIITFESSAGKISAKCFGDLSQGSAIALRDESGQWWVYSEQKSQNTRFTKQIEYKKIDQRRKRLCPLRPKRALINGVRDYESTRSLVDCLQRAGFADEDIIFADSYNFSALQNNEIDLNQFSIYTAPYSFYLYSSNLHYFALEDECLVKIIFNEFISGLEISDFNKIEYHQAILLGETYTLLTIGTWTFQESDPERLFGSGIYEKVSRYRTVPDRFWIFYEPSKRLFNINDDTSVRFYSLTTQQILSELEFANLGDYPASFYINFLPDITSFLRRVFLCEWCEENPF